MLYLTQSGIAVQDDQRIKVLDNNMPPGYGRVTLYTAPDSKDPTIWLFYLDSGSGPVLLADDFETVCTYKDLLGLKSAAIINGITRCFEESEGRIDKNSILWAVRQFEIYNDR